MTFNTPDEFVHYCLDCRAVVNRHDKVCHNCGADISEFIEEDLAANENEVDASFLNLMTNEKILSEKAGLILTTHRIRQESQGWGFFQIKSIMLDELASCVAVRSSNPILLVLAALCIFAGFLVSLNSPDPLETFVAAVLLAIVLVIVYFVSRRQILSLAAVGTTIRVQIKTNNIEELKQLMDEIETAKNDRCLMLVN